MIAPVTDDGVREFQVHITLSYWYSYYSDARISYEKQSLTILEGEGGSECESVSRKLLLSLDPRNPLD